MTRTFAAFLLAGALLAGQAEARDAAHEHKVAVAPQYDTTHVYVAPEDVDRFVASFTATFGGGSFSEYV